MDIEKLKELMGKATPGPWHATELPYEIKEPIIRGRDNIYVAQTVYDSGVFGTDQHPVDTDTELIVEAVNQLPDLLAELERLTRVEAAAMKLAENVASMDSKDWAYAEDGDFINKTIVDQRNATNDIWRGMRDYRLDTFDQEIKG